MNEMLNGDLRVSTDVVVFPNGSSFAGNPSSFPAEGEWEHFVGSIFEPKPKVYNPTPDPVNVAVLPHGDIYKSPGYEEI